MCVRAYHCAQLSYTAQNSSDNFPSYSPDNHRSSDEECWGEYLEWELYT